MAESSFKTVKPHLAFLMKQLSCRRRKAHSDLKLEGAETRLQTVECCTSKQLFRPNLVSKVNHEQHPFGKPDSGWIPKKQLFRVLRILHDEQNVVKNHANSYADI